MFFWTRFPFLRFLIFLIAGIELYRIRPYNPTGFSWIFYALFIIYILFSLLLKKDRFRKYNLFIGVQAMIILVISGYALSGHYDQKNLEDHLLYKPEGVEAYSGTVSEVNGEDSSKINLIIRCRMARIKGLWENTSGKIYLTINKEPGFSSKVHPGDLIIAYGAPGRIRLPLNPHQFNYAGYMARKNIYFRHSVPVKSFRIIGKSENLNPIKIAQILSNKFQSILSKYIKDYDTWSLVSTLVVGARDKLDESLESDYATVGISHILSVSGLHVGIIYMVLFFILQPVYRHPKTRWLASIIIISILIVYAFITGLTPSVLRSVFMFSLIELGRRIGRKGITINILAVSAFFLLCADPFFLYFVGFQLSYLAVAGIICFHSHIYKIFSFENAFADYVWQIVSVSTAAQITTLPLTLYYFHNFPVYFILANILAIPASFFLLVSGLAILAVNYVPLIPDFFGLITSWISNLFNRSIHFIGHLPFSQVRDIYINEFMVLLLFLIIIMIIQLLDERKIKFIYGIAIFLLIFCACRFAHEIKILKQKKIIFYYCNDGPIIEFVNGAEGKLYSTTELSIQKMKIRKLIINNCIAEGHPYMSLLNNSSLQPVRIDKSSGFDIIVREGKSFVIIYNSGIYNIHNIKKMIHADFIVLSNNSGRYINKIINTFSADRWIIDGSNDKGVSRKIQNKLKKTGILPFALEDQGTVEFNL